jgi:hypothetical protein
MERFFSGLVPNSKLEMSGWFKVQVNYKSRCRFLVVRNWYSITPMNIASYLGWSKLKALVKQGWELRSESFHESFLNSHVPVKQEQELHESWWELREFPWEFSQLSCPSQTRTRVTQELTGYYRAITKTQSLSSTLMKIWTSSKCSCFMPRHVRRTYIPLRIRFRLPWAW